MKSAVIYARYSCDAQTEQSIEGQLRVCHEYAERNGIVIVDTYIDIWIAHYRIVLMKVKAFLFAVK